MTEIGRSTATAIPLPRSSVVPSDLGQSRGAASAPLASALNAVETDRGLEVSLAGDILFDFDSARIRASALPPLRELAALIASEAPGAVLVEGHTDALGSEDYNRTLGAERAASVATHLIERHGLDSDLFRTESFGETRPIAPNAHEDGSDDPVGRQQNRRVEVILVR